MKTCLLCGKKITEEKDFLSHLYIVHKVRSVEDYEAQFVKVKAEEERTERYQKRVQELVGRLKRKEIPVEEYRRLLEQTKR